MTKRKLAARKGYTLIELVLVMFLLVFIAMSVFSLTGVGSEAFLRLSHSQAVQSDLRIGLSYLDVKLRQHNTVDAIQLENPPFTAETAETGLVSDQALRISRMIEGASYELWIYHYNGYLYELLTEPGSLVNPDMGTRIVKTDVFSMENVADDALTFTLSLVDEQGRTHTRSRTITLRTGDIGQ